MNIHIPLPFSKCKASTTDYTFCNSLFSMGIPFPIIVNHVEVDLFVISQKSLPHSISIPETTQIPEQIIYFAWFLFNNIPDKLKGLS